MMYKFLIILCIIVPGIDSSLELSYINSSGIPCSSHRSVRPIPTSTFEFIGITKMKSPDVNTCASLFPNSDGVFPYKGYVKKVAFR